MTRPMSRAQRMEAFLREARQMYSDLEGWYETHPEASFGEIEEEARQRRRALMGHVLEVLINGRDTGFQVQLPQCTVCGTEMDFEGYKVDHLRFRRRYEARTSLLRLSRL
jgi:hypothetical protein